MSGRERESADGSARMPGDGDGGERSDGRVAVETETVWPADADDVDEAYVANWFAREGRSLTAGETVCEIQIEKVSVDVPAPVAGTLDEIVVPEGDECRRGETLGWIRPSPA
jgi:pyruvate/2-oxoglutarate dehydrogenase complex dihydrolipoamide acyltransferase (E2) component